MDQDGGASDMKKIILIAQETVEARKDVLMALEPLYKENYYLFSCSSGDDIFKKIPMGTPSCIILDLNLPEMNGFEVLNKLKSNPRTSDIPVIILTSPMQGIFKLMSINLGTAGYTNRPISSSKLINLVRTVLGVAND
jgi:DNA-binding response OmpR family regulator